MYPKFRNDDKLLYIIKVLQLLIASSLRPMAFQLLMAFIQYKMIYGIYLILKHVGIFWGAAQLSG
jgi:hypothetical protein